MFDIIRKLDDTVVDWSDLEAASAITIPLVRELSQNKAALRYLLDKTWEDRRLREVCECHKLINKLVIYMADDRGIRIRLHISTDHHLDRPHDHRFSFTSCIMKGSYQHVLKNTNTNIYAKPQAECRISQDIDHADDSSQVEVDSIYSKYVATEIAGNCYTLNHEALHSVTTTKDTVSLFLRGPAEKDVSLVTDKQTGLVWWRFGQLDELPERRKKVSMSHGKFRELCQQLERLNLV